MSKVNRKVKKKKFLELKKTANPFIREMLDGSLIDFNLYGEAVDGGWTIINGKIVPWSPNV